MKVVVTGALGHIGSAWIRSAPELLQNAEFVLIDDLSTQRYCSLFDLPTSARYEFVEADIQKSELKKYFVNAHCVIHLAAITNAAGSFEIKDEVERVNFLGSVRVADTCAELGIPLIFPSTTSVYGTQDSSVDEDCPATELKPQSPYAESKLKSEHYLSELGNKAGLKFATLRFGTIYGVSPGMRFHTAVNKFCWQAVMNQPLTVWRTALHQFRPYLDLSDACRALNFVIAAERFDNRITNVVTENASVHDVIQAIRATGLVPKVEFVENQIMNQLSYHVTNKRLSETDFEFSGSLERGVAATIERLRWANSSAHTAWVD